MPIHVGHLSFYGQSAAVTSFLRITPGPFFSIFFFSFLFFLKWVHAYKNLASTRLISQVSSISHISIYSLLREISRLVGVDIIRFLVHQGANSDERGDSRRPRPRASDARIRSRLPNSTFVSSLHSWSLNPSSFPTTSFFPRRSLSAWHHGQYHFFVSGSRVTPTHLKCNHRPVGKKRSHFELSQRSILVLVSFPPQKHPVTCVLWEF